MKLKHTLATLLALGVVAAAGAQAPTVSVPGITDKAGAAPAPAAAPAAAPAPNFTDEQMLEEYGWFIGKRLGLAELEFTKGEVDAIVKGLLAAANNKDAPYVAEQIGPKMDELLQKKQATYMGKLKAKSLEANNAFFNKLKADNKNVVETPSGLRYEIITPGTGANPKADDSVKVHYTGTLIDGTKFDSSVDRGQPAEFKLSEVITGWTEGIQKMKKGGKIKLYVPPQLAYGDDGRPGIPPGSTLIFDVELLDITPGAPAAPAATTAK